MPVSAHLPAAGSSPLVGKREHVHRLRNDLVPDRVGIASQHVAAKAVLVFSPHACAGSEAVQGVEHFGSEGVCGEWASLEVPKEGLADFSLCLGQQDKVVRRHRELRRAFASAQGSVRTVPARNALRRRISSSRHASETAGSALPSRLSSNATTSADRSSVGRPSASSRRWPTRAFMRFSRAPAVHASSVRDTTAPFAHLPASAR